MTGRTNLDAQGRDNGWARDGSGKLVALNSSDDVLRVALASQPKQPADEGIRVERESNSRRWLVIIGKSVHPFDNERAAFLFMRHLKHGLGA
jgi:hypothetical protein